MREIPDNLPEYPLTSENDLHLLYGGTLSAHYDTVPIQTFQGIKEYSLAYKVFKVADSKASVVVSSGRTETMLKYKEIIYDLCSNGYNVYIFDHRGQGFSQRIDPENPEKGDVEDFDHYVDDLHIFMEKIVKQESHTKLFGLAHSMGGAILSLYIQRYRDDFDGVAMSAPMHQPKLLHTVTTGMFCQTFKYYRNQLAYIPGMGPWWQPKSFRAKRNPLTHSMIRFSLFQNEYAKHEAIRLGAPTIRWIVESCKACKEIIDNAHIITTPTLVLQAENDLLVNNIAQKRFCMHAGEGCRGYMVHDAAHELLMESDHYRKPVFTMIFGFFDRILSG